jgi:hypothetical protein
VTHTSRSIPARAPKAPRVRVLRAAVALVGALALAGVPALAASADDAPVGSITVTVTDGIGGPPLQGMNVQAMSPIVPGGLTDAAGQYTLAGLANGSYSINVGDPSSVFQSAGVESIEVSDAAPHATATVALTRFPTGTGVVSGRVVDLGTGQPIAGAFVTLGGLATLFKNRSTGADGLFTFDSLGTDTDTIMVTAIGYSFAVINADVDDNPTNLGDIPLARLTATITGTVRDQNGDVVAGVPVTVHLDSQPPSIGDLVVATDPDGVYTTDEVGRPSLQAGSYTLSAGGNGGEWTAISTPVTVADGETATADISLSPRLVGSVFGRVLDSEGAPIADVCVSAVDATSGVLVAQQLTDPVGQWNFPDLSAGDYTFRLRACGGDVDYGATYLGGSTPASATVVTVASQGSYDEGDTVLHAGATITGHVDVATATGTAPMPSDRSVLITVWQRSGGDWVESDPDRMASMSTSGDFTVRGLAAGEYRVEFSDQLQSRRAYATQYWNQSSSAGTPTLDDGTSIVLAEGAARAGVNAHLSTVRPADVPDAVATGALADGDQKTLTTSGTVAPGQHLTLSLGAEHAGEWVSVWGHSTPTLIADWVEVSATGTVVVTVPTTFPTGAHRLVAQTADGTVIGWEPLTVSDSATVTPPVGSSVTLPAKALGVSKTTTATTGSASTVTAEPAPTPSATADASAGSGAAATSGSGAKATTPVVSPASGGLPVWLLVLIFGLGAIVVASMIIMIVRRVRA